MTLEPQANILVIEDNVIIAMMMEADLEDAGYAVVGPVSTGTAAFDIVKERDIAVALVDVDLLDGESGIDVARRLTHEYKIPCIFVTGQVEEAARHPDAGLGVLAKPMSAGSLAETVRAVLSGARPDILRLHWFELTISAQS